MGSLPTLSRCAAASDLIEPSFRITTHSLPRCDVKHRETCKSPATIPHLGVEAIQFERLIEVEALHEWKAVGRIETDV